MAQSPEEPASPGVFGRIGSWLSPWTRRSPRTSAEDASPTDGKPAGVEWEEGNRDPKGGSATRDQLEEELGQGSGLNQLSLSRDIFSSKEADATQSAHRVGPPLARRHIAAEGGGPAEEEFFEALENKEEEQRGGTSSPARRNRAWEKNASHLTHPSPSGEQGVERSLDQTKPRPHSQVQAQPGRKLRVYLEETSVTHSGEDTASKKVICTKTKKSLQDIAKPPRSAELTRHLREDSTAEESDGKRTALRSAPGTKGHSSSLVSVTLKSHIKTPPETPITGEDTEIDSMGRKSHSKRKVRKNSQGEEQGPSDENTPSRTPVGSPTTDSPQTPSMHDGTHLDTESESSYPSKQSSTHQGSPGGGKGQSASSATWTDLLSDKNQAGSQGSDSPVVATFASSAGAKRDMELDRDLDENYRVERKTETPESKRRSLKVSRSEVKFFPKKVMVHSDRQPEQDNANTHAFKKGLNTEDKAKQRSDTPEIKSSSHILKTLEEEPKPAISKLANKIGLFEAQAVGATGNTRKSPQIPRSADVSPARSTSEVGKADWLPGPRSRSADREGGAKASYAPANGQQLKSVKERIQNFAEACGTDSTRALPQKSASPRATQKSSAINVATLSITPGKSKPAIKNEKLSNVDTETTSKPVGPDTTSVVNIPAPRQDGTVSKTKVKEPVKAKEVALKPVSIPSDDPVKKLGDSVQPDSESSSQAKAPGRAGTHSKRRKSKESGSPVSPKGDMKQNPYSSKLEVGVESLEETSGTQKKVSLPKQVKNTASSLSDKPQSGSKPGAKQPNGNSQQVVNTTSQVSDRQMEPAFKSDSQDRTERTKSESSEKSSPEISKAERIKTDDRGAEILSESGEGTEGNSTLFVEERGLVSKDNSGSQLPSPPPSLKQEQPIAKEPASVAAAPAPKSDEQRPRQPFKKNTEKAIQSQKQDRDDKSKTEKKPSGSLNQNKKRDIGKDTSLEEKDTPKLHGNKAEERVTEKVTQPEKGDKQKTNHADRKHSEKPKQPTSLTENTITDIPSGRSQGPLGPDCIADQTQRNETPALIKGAWKGEPPEPTVQSMESSFPEADLPPKVKTMVQTAPSHLNDAGVGAHTVANITPSVTEGDKQTVCSLEGGRATNMPEVTAMVGTSPGREIESAAATEQTSACGRKEPQPDSGVSVTKLQFPADDSFTQGSSDTKEGAQSLVTKVTATSEKLEPAAHTPKSKVQHSTETVTENEVSAPTSKIDDRVTKTVESLKADGNKPVSPHTPVSLSNDGSKASGNDMLTAGKTESSHPQREQVEKPQALPKNKSNERTTQVSSGTATTKINVQEKESNKKTVFQANELLPVVNGDIHSLPQRHADGNDPQLASSSAKTIKVQPSAERRNRNLENFMRNKMPSQKRLSGGEFSCQRDAPSSWLDVDFPIQKPKLPEPKLSSSVSESNLLDSPDVDDEDFIEKIKNLCAPFSLPPRKHSHLRPPQPPFAMPAIREDRFEKTFDPDEFQFGLRKKKMFGSDSSPGLLAKLKGRESKSSLKAPRVSVADRSMLLSSMDIRGRLREAKGKDEENEEEEEKEEQVKVKSRLEGSCVLSGLLTSGLRGRRNSGQAQDDSPRPRDSSPSEVPQPGPPSVPAPTPVPTPAPLVEPVPTPAPLVEPVPAPVPSPARLAELAPAPVQTPAQLQPSPPLPASLQQPLANQSAALDAGTVAQAVVSDSGPPLPSFNDIKLPDYLGKYLPQDQAKAEPGTKEQEQMNTEGTGGAALLAPTGGAKLNTKPRHVLPDGGPLLRPRPQTHELRANTIGAVRGLHRRPGKILVFESSQFSGTAFEIFRDVEDATSFQLSPLISIKVVRGCWVLYEKPGFQGRSIALEEGCLELTNVWAEPGPETHPQDAPPMVIGSIRLAVSDYRVPHIDLYSELDGHGMVFPYHDDKIELGSYGVPQTTASIKVHCGVWLVFSDPGFQGLLAVLEAGEYPCPESWGFPSPFIGSLRPLKMGGFKVENPTEAKALVYEGRDFQGPCVEIDSDVFSFEEEDGDQEGAESGSAMPKAVGSVKIVGGLWVGYSQPGFEGQQFVLEEGEYLDWNDWGGGSEFLLSIRPITVDFLSPHLKMFSDRDFGEKGVNIDLSVPVPNMEETGFGFKTQSVDVLGGVWVVFEEDGFRGDPYVLERGLYGSPEDWGGSRPRIGSIMPVALDNFENSAKFKVQLFPQPDFQGPELTVEDDVPALQQGFTPASCKVLVGSWLAFEGQDFTGRMLVLEMGSYPDLKAMGCMDNQLSIQSLQTTGFEFSLPSITLCERGALRGRRVVLTSGCVNLQLAGGCSRVQSVLVEGGMWVLYKEINYRGAQIFLRPGEILDWHDFSSWQRIGSLRPLPQRQVHFHLRNSETGLLMSVSGELDDVKLARIQEMEETGGLEQVWVYQDGHLHCKLLEQCHLAPLGNISMPGSRLGLSAEPCPQPFWTIPPQGAIRYTITPDLALEVKGGQHFDKNQVILNTFNPNKLAQRWTVEIL